MHFGFVIVTVTNGKKKNSAKKKITLVIYSNLEKKIGSVITRKIVVFFSVCLFIKTLKA